VQPATSHLRPHPLLLLVHGRSGGVVPAELQALAADLQARRGVPVALRALTAPAPVPPPRLVDRPLALVPLLLLPGGHVRHDVATVLAELRRGGPVRRWPFLGAWPAWQAVLAREVAALAGAGAAPRLLHHPLEGPLAARYLAHLAHRTGAVPLAAPYDAPCSTFAAMAPPGTPIPLALATCRLTEALAAGPDPAAARPLLARPGLRAALLQLLESLP
jgi:sirohydrochlorin ferrochelatase